MECMESSKGGVSERSVAEGTRREKQRVKENWKPRELYREDRERLVI